MSQPHNRVLFLDIDGVMNSHWSMVNIGRSWPPSDGITAFNPGYQPHFLPEALEVIHELVEKHGFVIVLSSTWRLFCTCEEMAHLLGLPKEKIIGKTPTSHFGHRGEEIQEWIDQVKSETNLITPDCEFIIIDDDNDMLPHQQAWFIETTFGTGKHPNGLNKQHLEKILTKIGR